MKKVSFDVKRRRFNRVGAALFIITFLHLGLRLWLFTYAKYGSVEDDNTLRALLLLVFLNIAYWVGTITYLVNDDSS